ncbi:ABC transporter permease [Butyrivibrio sp. XBB1001]|uniref:ABC transporter permease n=1 Tax=Butyrivibrio sp. XBB1001 TaxID=1280682 RepID=UPI0004214A7B|nr:FtsX-like permease family protein [Butyrivibrio sp. XBB1001]
MNSNLLGRLAFNGLKNNKKTILPYVLVSSITVMVFHILMSLVYSRFLINDGHPMFYGADYIVLFLHLGSIAVAVFSVIFLMYGNRFVQKSGKKEIGLYGVLGLSKKNVSRVLLIQSSVQALVAMVFGILASVFVNKLVVLFLYKLVHQPVVKGMEFSLKATIITVLFFGLIFIGLFVFNLLEVRLGNPIDLLKSENLGEKEPKTKWVLLVIGAVTLFAGYFIAVNIENTFSAISSLFTAIVLVTIGTYALFIAGTIFVLKMLKKNKKYYYQTKHFISLSNLIFRMKHNAAGLASICILSTAVILLMVCSSSLVMLGEQNINSMFRRDIVTWCKNDGSYSSESLEETLDEALLAGEVDGTEKIVRLYHEDLCFTDGEGLTPLTRMTADFSQMRVMYMITADQYLAYTGENVSLGQNEILRYSSADKVKKGSISIFGKNYQVKEKIGNECLVETFDPSMGLFSKEIIVVSDENELASLIEARNTCLNGEKALLEEYDGCYLGFNVPKNVDQSKVDIVRNELSSKLGNAKVGYKVEEQKVFYSIYGGTFFVGIFLAALFLIATVMIIFYKQMSEGIEDKKRFEILSNAGLSDKEAKGVIRNQVMIMFFLPAVCAIIHIIFASRILRLFLAMILYVDTFTFNLAIAIVSLIFLGTYALVYHITSRQYYEIVYGK